MLYFYSGANPISAPAPIPTPHLIFTRILAVTLIVYRYPFLISLIQFPSLSPSLPTVCQSRKKSKVVQQSCYYRLAAAT